jgi:hypothetical protein
MWLSVRNSLSNGFIWLLALRISHVLQTEASSPPALLLSRSETPQSSVHRLAHQLMSLQWHARSGPDVVRLFIAMGNGPPTSIAKIQQV